MIKNSIQHGVLCKVLSKVLCKVLGKVLHNVLVKGWVTVLGRVGIGRVMVELVT